MTKVIWQCDHALIVYSLVLKDEGPGTALTIERTEMAAENIEGTYI